MLYWCASQYFVRKLPHSYTWENYPIHTPDLWKKRTSSNTRSSEMLIQTYTARWFFYIHFLLVVSICEQAASKNLQVKNMCIYRNVRKKWVLSYTNQENLGQSYTLCWKSGCVWGGEGGGWGGVMIYLAALIKGVIRHAHPYYAIYRKLSPPPSSPRA